MRYAIQGVAISTVWTGDSRCAVAGVMIASRPMMPRDLFRGIPLRVRAGALSGARATLMKVHNCVSSLVSPRRVVLERNQQERHAGRGGGNGRQAGMR